MALKDQLRSQAEGMVRDLYPKPAPVTHEDLAVVLVNSIIAEIRDLVGDKFEAINNDRTLVAISLHNGKITLQIAGEGVKEERSMEEKSLSLKPLAAIVVQVRDHWGDVIERKNIEIQNNINRIVRTCNSEKRVRVFCETLTDLKVDMVFIENIAITMKSIIGKTDLITTLMAEFSALTKK